MYLKKAVYLIMILDKQQFNSSTLQPKFGNYMYSLNLNGEKFDVYNSDLLYCYENKILLQSKLLKAMYVS